ncbi:hypothetical protein LTR87_006036 [Friedmanniomyces endolithicus]|nr:hypothetical protein LTR87_006036 [Friedmanniomyces endolithicus]
MAVDTDLTIRNLDHIYFFVENRTPEPTIQSTRSPSPTSLTLSRSASPSVGSSDGGCGSGSGSSSSGNSALNPLAAKFEPTVCLTPSAPTTSKIYECREVEGKGLALFATSLIPIGTCIVSEEPLLHIGENVLHLAWGPLDAEDVEELVQDQVRVMGIFACNNFQCGKGLAVFATTSRLNHSCVPNVHHSYNPTIKKQTVYAVRDIQAGEELCTTYLGGQGVYYVRAQRIESLRNNYGFTCACVSCSDMTGQSDARREFMSALAYGLQVFQYGSQSPDPVQCVPTSPVLALKQAEDLIYMLIEEGILSIELCKAYRLASMVALGLGDFERAREYASSEVEVERNCLGSRLDDLVKNGAGAACWSENVDEAMKKAGVLPPAAKGRKPKSASQKLAAKMKKKQKKAAERGLQLKAERDAGKEQKAAEKRAQIEAQREEERKRREYDAAFPGLKG